MMTLKATQKGVTLIELLIVVAIIGIITSIALPNYQDYLKNGKAAEATSNLADLKIKAEQFFQDNRTYDGISCAPIDAEHFTYACTAADGSGGTGNADGYLITATGVAAKGMAGFEFSVNHAGQKKSTYDGGTPSNGCWATTKAGC